MSIGFVFLIDCVYSIRTVCARVDFISCQLLGTSTIVMLLCTCNTVEEIMLLTESQLGTRENNVNVVTFTSLIKKNYFHVLFSVQI